MREASINKRQGEGYEQYTVKLPELKGTTKQVRWANSIRDTFILRIQAFTDHPSYPEGTDPEKFIEALQVMLANNASAANWIDKFKSGAYSEDLALKEVLNYYNILQNGEAGEVVEEPTAQQDVKATNAKGFASEVLSVTKKNENDDYCEIKGFRKSDKLVTTLRKMVPHKSKVDVYTFVMNCDIYEFRLTEDTDSKELQWIGVDIKWIGNYKQGIWSEDATDEDKQIGTNESIKDAAKDDDNEIFHEQYAKIIACVKADIPVYLVGPAGSGKNHTLEQIARQLKMDFYFTNSIQQEHKLTGFIDAGGIFHETEFYKAFTNGGLFFLDEMDASIPEVLVLLNAAIANGYFEFPNGRAEAHINFRVVAAGNTMGSGADDQYTGRLVLDQATLDRFAIIEFNYDLRVEARLAKGDLELVNFVRDLREQSERLGIRATYSYRCIISATKLKGILTTEEIITIAITKGIDKETIKTYQTNEDNNYSKVLRQMQRSL